MNKNKKKYLYRALLMHYIYNNTILFGNMSKAYRIQGIRIIKATTTGNKTVQQNDIS